MKMFLCGAAALAMCNAALADFGTGYEPRAYSGSPGGTIQTGQDGWYNPVAGSNDFNVFTYADNPYGIPANPAGGGDQFSAGRSSGGTAFARSQRDMSFSAGGLWRASFDFAANFNGALPTADNLGSLSLQPSTTNSYWQTLYTWTDVATATNFDGKYIFHDAAGVQQTAASPGPGWTNLALKTWYRQTTTWDFATNKVTEVTITDLTTGVTSTANPVDWYMFGGAAGAPLPTAIRTFAGGNDGNITAWDNVSVQAIPTPATGLAMLGGLVAMQRRRRA